MNSIFSILKYSAIAMTVILLLVLSVNAGVSAPDFLLGGLAIFIIYIYRYIVQVAISGKTPNWTKLDFKARHNNK